MLQNISIQNFRCFHDAHFTDFNQINLLGGQNNAGKTALLEAIYLFVGDANHSLSIKNIHLNNLVYDIFNYRKIDLGNLYDYLGDKTFDNLFNSQDNTKVIKLIQIEKKIMKGDITFLDYYEREIKYDKVLKKLVINGKTNSFCKVTFIPTDYKLATIDLVKSYDELEMQGKEDILLKALQTIDPNLEKIRSFASNPLSLYIKRKGENYLPISFFGDAMNKMAHYILHIIQAKKGILLIDEIENGIHYTHQKEFWQSLLALAKAFEVQIFATSHSLEMIKAFNEVAMQPDFEEKCTYFEMVKHAKTGEITANALSMPMLKHEITKNNPFRGE